jgi:glycosyltransferase involved in cell wall biosynthesis
MPAPLLISLPHGLNASGVTTWAVRLVNALAPQGRACALVVHDEPPGQRAIDMPIHPGVEVFDARALPALGACGGDLSDYLPVYRVALGVLALRAGGPVVCMPNLLGDSYGLFAELSRATPDLVRTVAVHHADLRYNDLLCTHYAGHLSAFVGVSGRLTDRLRSLLPGRGPDIYGVAHGVEPASAVRPREPLAGRPLRLLYTGRMDHEQKRIGALVAMSDALVARGVSHELALLGDGPAGAEIDDACASRPCVRRLGPIDPAGVGAALERADLFVLASRYEGFSVSLLEALARGALPVLTPSLSGTDQLVTDGWNGFIADATPDCPPERAGSALAAAVERAIGAGDLALHVAREHALAMVRAAYSAEVCARRYAAIIDRAARAPARPWPRGRPAAFTGRGDGSATVPHDAQERLTRLLARLRGRRLAVYGTGRHTIELRDAFVRAGADIAAFLDDDRARHGHELWGIPIVAPEHAATLGATDIVISSWLHQDAMAARCTALPGVTVHTLYQDLAPGPEPRASARGAAVAGPGLRGSGG